MKMTRWWSAIEDSTPATHTGTEKEEEECPQSLECALGRAENYVSDTTDNTPNDHFSSKFPAVPRFPRPIDVSGHLVTNGILHALLVRDTNGQKQSVCAVGDVPDTGSEDDSDQEEAGDSNYAIIDGGAGDNLFMCDADCWKTYGKSNSSWGTAKRNERIRAAGEGRITILVEADDGRKFALEVFAYHVPQLAMNLMSVHYLCQRGYVVEYSLPNTFIKTRCAKNVVLKCPSRGRLWALPFQLKIKPQEEYVFISAAMHPSIYRLHEKYGHASLQKLKRMAIVGELDDEDKEDRIEVNLAKGTIDCQSCAAGVQAKKRGEKKRGQGKREYDLWELVSTDHVGPYPPMYGGYRYLSLFVEHKAELSILAQVYTCTSSETKEGMEDVYTLVKAQVGIDIKRMRSDKGSDYTSREVKDWAASKGVVLETVPPDGHGQLGRAEARIGVLNRIARTLMRRAGAPHKFFFFAVMHIAARDNRSTHNKRKSSYEQAWGKKPRNLLCLPWGCEVMAVDPRELGKEEHDRGQRCVFLGADYTTRDAATLLHINTNSLISRRSFRAFPRVYPFRSLDRPKSDKTDALHRAVDEILRDRGMDDVDVFEGGRVRMRKRMKKICMESMKITSHLTIHPKTHLSTTIMNNETIMTIMTISNHTHLNMKRARHPQIHQTNQHQKKKKMMI